MAKWKVAPGTVGNQLTGTVDYDEHQSRWEIKQDVSDILREVERDRELLAVGRGPGGWRKAFTVPDIVAIQILQDHGLDIHADDFMHDRNKMDRLKKIIKSEYPYLLIST